MYFQWCLQWWYFVKLSFTMGLNWVEIGLWFDLFLYWLMIFSGACNGFISFPWYQLWHWNRILTYSMPYLLIFHWCLQRCYFIVKLYWNKKLETIWTTFTQCCNQDYKYFRHALLYNCQHDFYLNRNWILHSCILHMIILTLMWW